MMRTSASPAHAAGASIAQHGKSKHQVAQSVISTISGDLHDASMIHKFADHALEIGRDAMANPKDFAEKAKKAFEYAEMPKKTFEYLRGFRHGMRDLERAGEAARQHVKLVAQIGNDVARVKRQEQLLLYWAETFGSGFAKHKLMEIGPAVKALKVAYHSEKRFIKDYAAIWGAHVPRQLPTVRAGAARIEGAMAGIEKAMLRNRAGRHLLETGRILTNEHVLNGVGAVAGAAAAFEESASETGKGKLVNTALAGAVNLGAAYSGLTKADSVLEKAFGKHNTVESFYRGVSDVVSAYSDVYFKHDSQALSAVHRKSMEGQYSAVLQGYSMIGEAISKSGWMDNKLAWAADTLNGVPKDFRTSLVWWGSH